MVTGVNALQATPMYWRWPAWINCYRDNEYVVHRCGDKIWSNKMPKWYPDLPRERIVEALFRKLVEPWVLLPKKIITNRRQNIINRISHRRSLK